MSNPNKRHLFVYETSPPNLLLLVNLVLVKGIDQNFCNIVEAMIAAARYATMNPSQVLWDSRKRRNITYVPAFPVIHWAKTEYSNLDHVRFILDEE